MLKKLNKLTYILSLLSMIIMIIMLKQLNILPNKYLIVLIISFSIIYLVLGLITFKVKNKIGTIILIVIEFLLGIFLIIFSSYISKTNDFINKIDEPKEEAMYYVVVLKESNLKNIKDLKNKTIGSYSLNDDNYSNALNKLKNKINIKEKEYSDLSMFADDLLSKESDAILISDFNKEMLDEEINDFNNKTKILYTIKIEIKNEVKENNVKINQETFNVLISGIDTRGAINKVSRSDVNIVVTINPQTNEILLTSIPRDYYVQLHNTKGSKDKLTHAGIYGINMSLKTIEDLLNTKIDYYLRVNFDTLINLVDTIDGIDVYSDSSFKAYNGDTFVEGINHLNGKKALAYSRERKQFKEGDRKRGEHQEQVITAIIEKVTSSKVLLTNYKAILENLSNSFQTSIPADTIKYFVKEQLNEMAPWTIKSISLDGVGSKNYTYSMPGRLLYVMLPDQNTVNEASTLINNMMNN